MLHSRFEIYDDGLGEWGEDYDDGMQGSLRQRVEDALSTTGPTANQSRLARLVEGMTPQQFAAATHDGSPLLILAGAGTGKTRTLTVRIALMITAGLAMPSEILALTFTNKAAAEMKHRIEALLELDAVAIQATTFHAFCARLLRDYGGDVGWATDWTIIDEDDAKRMMRLAYKEKFGENPEARMIKMALDAHEERLTDDRMTRDQWLAKWQDPTIRYLTESYQDRKYAENVRDFNDLINEALDLLENHSDVLELVRQRFRHVLVDEYQDTDGRQERILRLLMGTNRNLTVVGDEDQLVYTWRHARIDNILDFAKRWSAETVRLEQNFRSTQIILDAANLLISKNKMRLGKTLYTFEDDGPPIALTSHPSPRAEADLVIDQIKADLAAGMPPDEIAVLCRASHALNFIEQALNREGIRYTLSGGKKFQERQEIKDVCAWLRLVSNGHDRSAFERAIATPKRGVGPTTLEDIDQTARKLRTNILDAADRMARGGVLSQNIREPMSTFVQAVRAIAADAIHGVDGEEIVKRIIQDSGYGAMLKSALAEAHQSGSKDEADALIQRLNNLRDLMEIARGRTLTGLLDHLGLSEATKTDTGKGIWLGTIHAAKGLEFLHVYLPAWEQGVMPSARILKDGLDIEEERRLAYVALTRARKKATLSYCQTRFEDKSGPSIFLADLGRVEVHEVPGMDEQVERDLEDMAIPF